MKNSLSIKKFLTIFVMAVGILCGNVVFAAKAEIIIFCASWNMKCRDATKVCQDIAGQEGLKYTEMDIDNPSTQQKARELGISYPSIPYIYYIDKKGNVVNGIPYRGESAAALKKELMIN